MPTRNVNLNNKENPFGTLEGQEIVSTSENFWARLRRIGSLGGSFGTTTIPASGTGTATSTSFVLYDQIFIAQSITVSANVDCQIVIAINPSGNKVPVNYANVYLKAGTPFTWYPDGSLAFWKETASVGGQLSLEFKNQSGAGTGFWSITGINIERNDV